MAVQHRIYDYLRGRVDVTGEGHIKIICLKSAELSVADRTWTHPQSGVEYVYEYPFRQLDREADMWEAYARFEGMG